jgi:enterochelin esterase-like enzyme
VVDDAGGTDLDWIVDDLRVESAVLGEPWRVLVQRPAVPLDAHGLPWIWMLHGRGGSVDEMRPLLASVADAFRRGELPPAVVVAPGAPEDHRTSWWIDSDHVPLADALHVSAGRLLESSLLDDVLPELERCYAGPDGPSVRVAGGVSMGGAAALRWVMVRPDLFGAAVLLSPGVFERLPFAGSAGRSDVFDVEASIFDTDQYARLLHYPTLLAAVDPNRSPVRVVVLVGDEEPVRADAIDRRDLELEAARLHVALKIHPAFRPSLRVVGGGHDNSVWAPGIVTALRVLAGREPMTPSP